MLSEIEINGHRLPDQLLRLIERQEWKLPKNCEKLIEITGISWIQEFDFFGLNSIEKSTRDFHILYQKGLGRIYGIESSKKLNRPIDNMKIMDIDHSLIIAGAKYEEIVIILDYRHSENPLVRMNEPKKGKINAGEFGFQLKTISNSFDEFVNALSETRP